MKKIKNKRKALAIIHLAKKELGLTDDTYRALLQSSAGIDSAKELQYQWQYKNIIESLKTAGFTIKPYHDQWGCSPQQRKLIETLWRQASRTKTEKSLYKFIEKVAGISHPRWLTQETTRKIILALKRMKEYAKEK